MAEVAIVVFTGKSPEGILGVGGTQSWVLHRENARRCKYAVVCQNAYAIGDWADGKEAHQSAFMVGVVQDVVPSTEVPDRWLVRFSEYARVSIPQVWQGWRNPVKYMTLEDLNIDPSTLVFERMPEPLPPAPKETPSVEGLTIAQAKKELAKTFGVPPDAIEITIRG